MSDTKKFELSPSVSIIIAGVIIAAAIVFVDKQPAGMEQVAAAGGAPTPTKLDVRPVGSGDHIVGSPNASIVLVEYSDFQCPFCTMIFPTLKKIVAQSGGEIALVQRHFPLASIHPQAIPAAHASECVAAQLGNDGYWKFAEAAFANQSKLSDSFYTNTAKELGADMAAFATCMKNNTYQDKIDQDTTEAQKNGGNGTPFTIVLNSKTGKMVPISGALPEAQIMSVINSLK